MRLEIDIPDHHYNNIMALDTVSLGRVPYKGIIMYAINAIKRGRVLEQEPKKGHWITHHESMTLLTGETATGGVVCSECGYKTHNKAHVLIGCPYKYCPDCGAKMVEPQESEESK